MVVQSVWNVRTWSVFSNLVTYIMCNIRTQYDMLNTKKPSESLHFYEEESQALKMKVITIAQSKNLCQNKKSLCG